MFGGHFGNELELRPLCQSVNIENSIDVIQSIKCIKNPKSIRRQLYLFQQKDLVIRKYEEEEEVEEIEDIVHQVSSTDTLEGLAIQYNVSVNAIKALNDLVSNDIFFRKELKIPQQASIKNGNQVKSHPSQEGNKKQKVDIFGEVVDKENDRVRFKKLVKEMQFLNDLEKAKC